MNLLAIVREARSHLEDTGRLSLRMLRRQYDLTDDALEEVIDELVEVQGVARREDKTLVWVDHAAPAMTETAAAATSSTEGDPRAYTPKHLADKILQSKSALEGERKQVTVLFADVKGSIELAEQLDPERWCPFIGILNSHAWFLSRLGRLDEATRVCQRGEDMARAYGDNEVLTWLQLPRIEVAMSRADAAAARNHARAAQETGAKATTPQSRFVGLLVPGIAHRLNGEWDESVSILDEAVRAVEAGNNRMFEGWVRTELAKALIERGDLDRAGREAQTAVNVANEQRSRYDEARTLLALIRIHLQRGEIAALADAEAAMVRVQVLVDETKAMAHQPEVHECRAHLAARRGDSPTFRQELRAAMQIYGDMGATEQSARLAAEIDS